MYRVIRAATEQKLDDRAVLKLIGRSQYDQLYKAACRKVDDEIVNQYGDVEVTKWTNGGCSATAVSQNRYAITSEIYADFISDRGESISCYAETRCTFDASSPRTYLSPEVIYFNDEMEYE